MATTATKKLDVPLATGLRLQIWRIAGGASDTSCTWKSGLGNVLYAAGVSQDDASHTVFPNSNDGTEGSSKGDVYLGSLANSFKADYVVLGS